MADKKLPGRFERAKSECIEGRTSMGVLKDDFRNMFYARLRVSRHKSVDKFRQIVENYGDSIEYMSIPQLRAILESDLEAANLLKEDEVDQALKQIDREMQQTKLQEDGEMHLEDSRNETNSIVDNHLRKCVMCGKKHISKNLYICLDCSGELLK